MKHWDCVRRDILVNYWGGCRAEQQQKEISGLVSEAGCEPGVLPIRTYTGRLRSGRSAKKGCLFQVSDIGKGRDLTI